MERRKFVGLFGLGLFASSFPVVLAACSSTEEAPSSAEPPATTDASSDGGAIAQAEDAADTIEGFTEVGVLADLNDGGSISTKVDGKKVYVFLNPDDQSVVALDPTCNHQGCPVKLAGSELECGCHGSRFDVDGSLKAGPATAGLTVYDAETKGDAVYVKVG